MARKKRSSRLHARDIARLAGVSQSSVSRALANQPGVSPETRDRIRQIAEEFGYHPNALASSLITDRTGLIGIVVSDMANPFLNTILEVLLRHLKRQGLQAMILLAESDSEIGDAASNMGRYRVDGCFVISPHLPADSARKYAALGAVVLLFNPHVEGLTEASAVSVDNVQAAAAVADYLLARGHRKIAFLHGVADSSTSRDRFRGFRDALDRQGVAPHSVGIGQYSYAGAVHEARRLLKNSDRPTAIFCANDQMAMAVIDTARSEFSLSVPRELAIVGFDDAPPASWPSYQLTTVRQPVEAVLDTGMRLMEQQLAGDEQRADRIVVPSELIIRGSA